MKTVEIKLPGYPPPERFADERLETAVALIAFDQYRQCCRAVGQPENWEGIGHEARRQWRDRALAVIEFHTWGPGGKLDVE